MQVELEQKTIDCVVQHLGTYGSQSKQKRLANSLESCLKCRHKDSCNLDWISIVGPLVKRTDIGLISRSRMSMKDRLKGIVATLQFECEFPDGTKERFSDTEEIFRFMLKNHYLSVRLKTKYNFLAPAKGLMSIQDIADWIRLNGEEDKSIKKELEKTRNTFI